MLPALGQHPTRHRFQPLGCLLLRFRLCRFPSFRLPLPRPHRFPWSGIHLSHRRFRLCLDARRSASLRPKRRAAVFWAANHHSHKRRLRWGWYRRPSQRSRPIPGIRAFLNGRARRCCAVVGGGGAVNVDEAWVALGHVDEEVGRLGEVLVRLIAVRG